jgi:hypothetical protein
MDADLASYAAARIRVCAELLSLSARIAKPLLTEDDFRSYSLQLSNAMGEIGTSLLFPIYKYYPQLDPGLGRGNDVSMDGIPVADYTPGNGTRTLTASVDLITERVRAELLEVSDVVRNRCDPREAAGFAQRIETVVGLVRQVRVPAAK